MKSRALAVLVAVFVLLPCLGHGLEIEASCEGLDCEIIARYHGGSAISGARVEIFGPDADSAIAHGETNEEGRFRCEVPSAGNHIVVVDDGHGHRSTLLMNTTEPTNVTVDPGDEHQHGPPLLVKWLGGIFLLVLLCVGLLAWQRLRRRS